MMAFFCDQLNNTNDIKGIFGKLKACNTLFCPLKTFLYSPEVKISTLGRKQAKVTS